MTQTSSVTLTHTSLHRPSAHATRDERLKVLVHASFEKRRRTCGSPRVHVDLASERVGRNRIIRLMQAE